MFNEHCSWWGLIFFNGKDELRSKRCVLDEMRTQIERLPLIVVQIQLKVSPTGKNTFPSQQQYSELDTKIIAIDVVPRKASR